MPTATTARPTTGYGGDLDAQVWERIRRAMTFQEGDRVLARCEIQRRTSSMVFCRADLVVGEQAVAAFTGVIKRLKPRN